MLKRTNSFILLTLLVLTGLAGKERSTTLTAKERRSLNVELKNSRAELMNAIEGLSARQLNFHLPGASNSIAACLYQLADEETSLWSATQQILSVPPQSLDHSQSHPAQVLTNSSVLSSIPSLSQNYSSADEALERYLNQRGSVIKYVQTTTDDVRSYLVPTSSGTYDLYQLLQLNAECSKNWTVEINRIKSSVLFPKR